jgi:ankyrin repeat protein
MRLARDYGNDLTALMWVAGHGRDVPPREGVETARLLLAHGARLDLADNRGRTALMIASATGHLPMVELLRAAGADPALRDLTGRTARDLALEEGRREVVEFLDGAV